MKALTSLLTLGALIAALAVTVTEPLLARDPPRVKAEEGFALIQAAIADGSPKEVQWVVPTDAVIGQMKTLDEVRAWRAQVVETLKGVKTQKARESGDDAAAQYVSRSGDAVMEIALHYAEGRWYVSGRTAYEVAGRALAATCGKKPARVELDMRTRNDQWQGTAVSFAYASKDTESCKNRMDVFFCHNGDLHAVRGRIADLGKGKLPRNGGIPLGVEWQQKVPATKGHSYAVHCSRRGRSDFYAGFTVKKVSDDGVQLQWTLLAVGFGAPASIHEPSAATDRDGADGAPGLCGRNTR